MSRLRAGFIGLGRQGSPIARRIRLSGTPVAVWARRPEVAARAAADWGAQIAESPAAVGRASDVVGICVFDAAGVEEVLFGPQGVAGAMAEGGIVLVHTTVSPTQIRGFAERGGKRGIAVLDAPVSGGPAAAESGELLAMLAGPAAAVDRIMPVVLSFAGRVARLGDVGAASLAKLLNNALLAAQVALVHEVLETGERHGVGDGLLDVLRAGSARSFAAELLAASGSLDVLLSGQFGPTISKDVNLLADELGRPEPRPAVLELAGGVHRRIARETESMQRV
jgi:3-hydroxyisobutyrate dehydrogenase-like beta-hydroxyacid dehydrogenase